MSYIVSNIAGAILPPFYGIYRIGKHARTIHKMRSGEENASSHKINHHVRKIIQGIAEVFGPLGTIPFWVIRGGQLSYRFIHKKCLEKKVEERTVNAAAALRESQNSSADASEDPEEIVTPPSGQAVQLTLEEVLSQIARSAKESRNLLNTIENHEFLPHELTQIAIAYANAISVHEPQDIECILDNFAKFDLDDETRYEISLVIAAKISNTEALNIFINKMAVLEPNEDQLLKVAVIFAKRDQVLCTQTLIDRIDAFKFSENSRLHIAQTIARFDNQETTTLLMDRVDAFNLTEKNRYLLAKTISSRTGVVYIPILFANLEKFKLQNKHSYKLAKKAAQEDLSGLVQAFINNIGQFHLNEDQRKNTAQKIANNHLHLFLDNIEHFNLSESSKFGIAENIFKSSDLAKRSSLVVNIAQLQLDEQSRAALMITFIKERKLYEDVELYFNNFRIEGEDYKSMVRNSFSTGKNVKKAS